MTTLREAATQALEALEDLGMRHYENTGSVLHRDVYESLKAALVEDAMQKFTDVNQELQAALGCDHCNSPLYAAIKCKVCGRVTEPAPPQRKPLNDEEILSVLRLAPPEPSLWPHLKDEAVVGDVQKAVLAIARAIERAHGIGGNDE